MVTLVSSPLILAMFSYGKGYFNQHHLNSKLATNQAINCQSSNAVFKALLTYRRMTNALLTLISAAWLCPSMVPVKI